MLAISSAKAKVSVCEAEILGSVGTVQLTPFSTLISMWSFDSPDAGDLGCRIFKLSSVRIEYEGR